MTTRKKKCSRQWGERRRRTRVRQGEGPRRPRWSPPRPTLLPVPPTPFGLATEAALWGGFPPGGSGVQESRGGWERGQFPSRSPPPGAEVCASVLGTQVPHWSQYIIITLGKSRRAYEVENCISFVLNLPNSKSSGRCFYFTYLLTVCSLLPQNAEYTIGIRFSFWP